MFSVLPNFGSGKYRTTEKVLPNKNVKNLTENNYLQFVTN